MHLYKTTCNSPLGQLILTADTTGLTGLWFAEQSRFLPNLSSVPTRHDHLVFHETKQWLSNYFQQKAPSCLPVPIHLQGTDFQLSVWKLLCQIPYGTTITYGQLAQQYAKQNNLNKMSAQAVGSAVGRNPISILVPCHRVIGANQTLIGYGGGLDRKQKLLQLEGVYLPL